MDHHSHPVAVLLRLRQQRHGPERQQRLRLRLWLREQLLLRTPQGSVMLPEHRKIGPRKRPNSVNV